MQALHKQNQKDSCMDSVHGGSQCMESAANGGDSVFVVSARGCRQASAAGGSGAGGGGSAHHAAAAQTWWEEWLESGKQPDWAGWKACTLPARSARSETMVSNDLDREGMFHPMLLCTLHPNRTRYRKSPELNRVFYLMILCMCLCACVL